MTWGIYIGAIGNSKITNDSQLKIVRDLFRYAEAKKLPSEKTAQSWISGNRNCKTSAYFPDNEMNKAGVAKYFRNRPEALLKNLQGAFYSV